MKIIRLLILLLSVNRPIITSAQLVQRQEQGVWPDFGLFDGLAILRGIGNFFQSPQDSDSSRMQPRPTTDTTSDRQTSPDSQEVAPASPSSLDAPSPTEPVYKLKIDNDPAIIPEVEQILPAALPSVNEKCDSTNASSQICDCFNLLFQRITFALIRTNKVIDSSMSQIVARPQINSFSPPVVLALIRTKSSQLKPGLKMKPFEKH